MFLQEELTVNKDFLSIADLNRDEIIEIFDLTTNIKNKLKSGESYHPLKGKTLAMIFQKPSARTRVSFETGMWQLGGYALYLAPTDIEIGKREAVTDIARVLSRYNDCIMARLFGHQDILELAKYANIPVINGLTDLLHPCQIMADVYTIIEYRNTIENLKIAYVGDGNNVANSWLNFASQYPINLNLAVPQGYEPDNDIYIKAEQNAISEINIYHDPREAVMGSDVIYTDVWVSMGQESEAEQRRIVFQNFQINDELLKLAKPNVLVMHCLPAHRGEEITTSVIDGSHSIVFDEAENRLHVQKAILVKLMTN